MARTHRGRRRCTIATAPLQSGAPKQIKNEPGGVLTRYLWQIQTTKDVRHRHGEQQKHHESESAALPPGACRCGPDRQQQQSDHTKRKWKDRIGQQKPKPELIDQRPLVHRFTAKNDHHASKTGERDRVLRSCAESFTWFHLYFRL